MNFNKVEITSDINRLDESFYTFMNQNEELRKKSDNYMIESTGYNNYDLYRRLRGMINSGIITESVDIEDINNDWSEVDQFYNMNSETYKQKFQQTENICNSLNRVVIAPTHFTNNYTLDILNNLYDQYNSLPQDCKNLSDYFSLAICGYSVKDMYNLMLNKFGNGNNFEPESYSNIIIGECIHNKDILQKELLEAKGYKVPKFSFTVSNDIPDSMPYFTSDEFTNIVNIDKIEELISKHSFYSTAKKLQQEYEKNPTVENENAVLEIGWNPSVKVTKESMEFARNKHIKLLNENRSNIIDLHRNFNYLLEDTELLTESSNAMKKLYKEKDIYPVYVVLSYVGGVFATLQRMVRKVHYTHAGLALDSNLKTIYTFAKWKVRRGVMDGFGLETLSDYIDMNKYALVDVLCVFVDGKTINKLKENLNYFVKNKKRTKYNIPNILNILFRRKVDYGPDNVSFVCSQFTDYILKTVNIDLTKKPSNLVEPQDFEVVKKNPKVYRVYDGYASRYNEKRTEAYTKILFDRDIRDNILIGNNNLKIGESIIDDLLTPDIVISESKFPISINNKGDLTIKQYKTLEEQYQESHKILEGYIKSNINGIKYELAKLFYLNSIIERKIKYMKNENETYKKSVNLRARILNDFKKYFKIVSTQDNTFDFGSYYENSEFGSYTIEGETIKNVGKLFIKFLAGL